MMFLPLPSFQVGSPKRQSPACGAYLCVGIGVVEVRVGQEILRAVRAALEPRLAGLREPQVALAHIFELAFRVKAGRGFLDGRDGERTAQAHRMPSACRPWDRPETAMPSPCAEARAESPLARFVRHEARPPAAPGSGARFGGIAIGGEIAGHDELPVALLKRHFEPEIRERIRRSGLRQVPARGTTRSLAATSSFRRSRSRAPPAGSPPRLPPA